mmetsp:Transcript_36199/g.115943  ORF Transcript_36199/g.115943 Transcript_36199/m.115943 type:complete len:330 (-) Transcript_36199:366-1355(-)
MVIGVEAIPLVCGVSRGMVVVVVMLVELGELVVVLVMDGVGEGAYHGGVDAEEEVALLGVVVFGLAGLDGEDDDGEGLGEGGPVAGDVPPVGPFRGAGDDEAREGPLLVGGGLEGGPDEEEAVDDGRVAVGPGPLGHRALPPGGRRRRRPLGGAAATPREEGVVLDLGHPASEGDAAVDSPRGRLLLLRRGVVVASCEASSSRVVMVVVVVAVATGGLCEDEDVALANDSEAVMEVELDAVFLSSELGGEDRALVAVREVPLVRVRQAREDVLELLLGLVDLDHLGGVDASKFPREATGEHFRAGRGDDDAVRHEAQKRHGQAEASKNE